MCGFACVCICMWASLLEMHMCACICVVPQLPTTMLPQEMLEQVCLVSVWVRDGNGFSLHILYRYANQTFLNCGRFNIHFSWWRELADKRSRASSAFAWWCLQKRHLSCLLWETMVTYTIFITVRHLLQNNQFKTALHVLQLVKRESKQKYILG